MSSLGNVVTCDGFSGDAVVESRRSSVHGGVRPGDVVVSGGFSGGGSLVWGPLCNTGGGRSLPFRLSGSQRSSGLKPEKKGFYSRKTMAEKKPTVSGSKRCHQHTWEELETNRYTN